MGKHSHDKKAHKKHKSRKTDKADQHAEDEEDEWVEKVVSTPAAPSKASDAPAREEWMTSTFDPRGGKFDKEDYTDGHGSGEMGSGSGARDFFSDLGKERTKEPKEAPRTEPKMARNELNTQIFDDQGYQKAVNPTASAVPPPAKKKKIEPGSSGSSWRMAKLKRVYETAEDEGRPIQEVALERYGSLEEFQDAQEERRILDERANPSLRRPDPAQEAAEPEVDEFGRQRRPPATPAQRRVMITDDTSRPSSRQSFKRPGQPDSQAPSRLGTPSAVRVPSVFTPPVVGRPATPPVRPQASGGPVLSQDALNKLQAKVLKAKLMDPDSAKTQALEREYDDALAASQAAGGPSTEADTNVQVLPTLDARGQLYDIGTAAPSADQGKKRRRKEAYFESRDRQTGEVLRYNADDDGTTLEEMVRQERFKGGAADQKNLDAEFAGRIVGDQAFKNDLDYMDDEVERLARKKQKTADQKRLFAINDFARTRKALESCKFCYQDTDTATVPPEYPMVALGTRAYLALPRYEGLAEGHCFIVPLAHQLNTVESDDDTWEEIKNFMKTLVKMFANQERGVLFYETVLSLKQQRHSYIECVPVPWKIYDEAPAYFRESILQAESEWSNNKRLVDFSKRPGGFRRSLVPELPYFMVCFDHKGEKGYGHVIEGHDGTQQANEEAFGLDEGEKGGGKFERFFGAEVLGNLLELEPRRWRKPRWLDPAQDAARVREFRKGYDKHDWTKMLAQEG